MSGVPLVGKGVRILSPVNETIAFRFSKVPGARRDVRLVTFSRGSETIRGYALMGGEGTYRSLLDQKGEIVGWEHSFCHEPCAYILDQESGLFSPMPPEVREQLRYGESDHRALWEKIEQTTHCGVVPGGRIVAFIPALVLDA